MGPQLCVQLQHRSTSPYKSEHSCYCMCWATHLYNFMCLCSLCTCSPMWSTWHDQRSLERSLWFANPMLLWDVVCLLSGYSSLSLRDTTDVSPRWLWGGRNFALSLVVCGISSWNIQQYKQHTTNADNTHTWDITKSNSAQTTWCVVVLHDRERLDGKSASNMLHMSLFTTLNIVAVVVVNTSTLQLELGHQRSCKLCWGGCCGRQTCA